VTPALSATFTNPLDENGPDPWLKYYEGSYYLAATTWNSTITMRKSSTLGGLATAPETVIFTLDRPNAAGTMWAPEFHLLDGPDGRHWYLYYTAGAEPFDLDTQRIHVIQSEGLDPMGPYRFKADMLDPEHDDTWELDGSILQLEGSSICWARSAMQRGSRPSSGLWRIPGRRQARGTSCHGRPTTGRRSAVSSTKDPKCCSTRARPSSSFRRATAAPRATRWGC
jgi:hypothetical protein